LGKKERKREREGAESLGRTAGKCTRKRREVLAPVPNSRTLGEIKREGGVHIKRRKRPRGQKFALNHKSVGMVLGREGEVGEGKKPGKDRCHERKRLTEGVASISH